MELAERFASNQDVYMRARQIETIDRQIDQLVYELYGLTEEEIAIVEKRRIGVLKSTSGQAKEKTVDAQSRYRK
jgi:hypothetical protein